MTGENRSIILFNFIILASRAENSYLCSPNARIKFAINGGTLRYIIEIVRFKAHTYLC